MTARFIISWNGGEISTTIETASETVRLEEGRLFTSPLSAEHLSELAWYYEAYPINAGPSGQFRAARVEAELPAWGVALFDAMIPKISVVREAWERHEGEDASLWLTGPSGEFLSLPWELARRSIFTEPLGQRHRMTRALWPPPQLNPILLPRVKRLLLIISRPTGSPGISFLLFARDLLRQMKSASRDIEVEVLRPPTFEAFCERVRAADEEGRPFDIVHFDGHGSIGDLGDGRGGVARLTFETSNGGAHHIDGAGLLRGLAGREIPLFVLAACHSGGIAPLATSETSIATSLIDGAAAVAVVAMSYAICADAAQIFLAAFYGAVLRGQAIAQAVSEGRRKLALNPGRHREHGTVNLQDWAIPVLYARAAAAFEPAPEAARVDNTATGAIGRDVEFFQLERLLRATGAVVLDGLAGIGKTALARDFLGWLAATSPGQTGVLTIDASESGTLAELTAAVIAGLGGGGSLGKALGVAQGPILIDGLDGVVGWSSTDRSALFSQVSGRQHPRSAVILVGRGLGALAEGIPSLTLGPLAPGALREILPAGIEPTAAVLEFLDGHPACAVSATPKRPGGLFPVELGDDALAAVRAALAALSDTMVQQLRLIAGHGPRLEFQSLKHLTGYFSNLSEVEKEETIRTPKTAPEGVADSRYEDWRGIIENCCAARIAEGIRGDIYRLHPGLGPALIETWRAHRGASFEADWASLQDRADDGVLATAGQLLMFMAIGTGLTAEPQAREMRIVDPSYVRAQMEVLESRIKVAILRSIARGQTFEAGFAAQALGMLWTEKGVPDVAYCDTVLARLRAARGLSEPFGARMLRFVIVQQLALTRHQSIADPETELREMLAEPEEWGEIGITGMNLGRPSLVRLLAVALDMRGRPEDAEPLAREAVEGFEARGDERGAADAKQTLAVILRNLGRNSAAFTVDERAGDDFRPYTPTQTIEAINLRANQSFDVGDLEAAMELQLSNLAVTDNNPRQRARVMHELGVLCSAGHQLEDAEQWLLKSLAIKDDLFGPEEGVRTRLMLGTLAVQRQRDEEAERWFLHVRQVTGGKGSSAAHALIGLAGIAARRGNPETALDGVLRAFALFEQGAMWEDAASLGRAQQVLLSATSERIEARWRSLKGADLSPQERLYLAESFDRIGLDTLSLELSAPLRSSDDPRIAARALVLQALSILKPVEERESWDPVASTADALTAADDAIARLEEVRPLPRSLVHTLGVALNIKAAILCSRGQKPAGAELAARAVETLQPFREGPEIERLNDYAHANDLLGMVSRDLGRWAQAAEAHLSQAEAYRLCIAGNSGFLSRRYRALHDAISSFLKAGEAGRALSSCAVLRGEMSRSLRGPAACGADPPMGMVVQATANALQALGDSEAVRKLLADRWAELDAFADSGSPGVLDEYVSWSLALLQIVDEPDQRIAARLRDVLAVSVDLGGFRPEHSIAMEVLIFQCQKNDHGEVANALRTALTDLDRRMAGRADIAAAAACADFDCTLGRGVLTTLEEDEALAARLRAGVIANGDPRIALRFGFAVEHAVAKRIKAGQLKAAQVLAQGLEDVALAGPDLRAACRNCFFGCRRNLAIGLAQNGDLHGAVSQIYRILDIAITAGENVKFDGEDHTAAKSGKVRTAGSQITEAVGNVMGRLAEAKDIATATKLLLSCLKAIDLNPRNDLVVAAAFAGCSNLLMRVTVPLQATREIYAGLVAARRARPDSDLLNRAFAVGAMGMVFTERTQGEIATARAAFEELVSICDGHAMGMLVAQAGLGLAKDLGQRGDIQGLVGVVTLMMPAICRSEELGPAIDDLAGAIDFSINSCLETEDSVTPMPLLDAARSLRETYSASAELTLTVGVAITNLIGHTRDPEQFRAWLTDLRALDSSSRIPGLADIRSTGMANAILGAAQHGLADVADDLYHELCVILGAQSGRPRPPALMLAFRNRIAGLCEYGQIDCALDELFDVAKSESQSPDWLAAAADQTSTLVAEVWSAGPASRRDRLSRLVCQLWRDAKARATLQARVDGALLESITTGGA
jgi:tetratricopeptide (TPR) repeat protein